MGVGCISQASSCFGFDDSLWILNWRLRPLVATPTPRSVEWIGSVETLSTTQTARGAAKPGLG